MNIGILDPDGKNNNPLTDQPYSDKYKALAKVWSKFPAYENSNDIIKTINTNQVVLVISGTGSGKTVLIPKYVLHQTNYKGHIMISLPKQIIAQSAAEFAALTMDVKLGEQIGYKYKGSDVNLLVKIQIYYMQQMVQ
jgi:pre-mRNA-splicing factor ATP-dependent RNA helicase DHX15/PRP43